MKLVRRNLYDVEFWYKDKEGHGHHEFDSGIKENDLEQIVNNILDFVNENGGYTINLSEIIFKPKIIFEKEE